MTKTLAAGMVTKRPLRLPTYETPPLLSVPPPRPRPIRRPRVREAGLQTSRSIKRGWAPVADPSRQRISVSLPGTSRVTQQASGQTSGSALYLSTTSGHNARLRRGRRRIAASPKVGTSLSKKTLAVTACTEIDTSIAIFRSQAGNDWSTIWNPEREGDLPPAQHRVKVEEN
jgi:hypothetical protein